MIAPAGGMLSPHDGLPIYTSPTEILSVTIKLAIKGGIVAAIPAASLTVFYLVRPLLNRHERRMVALFLPATFLFFLLGASFAYFVMIPVGIGFLLHFGEGIAVPAIRISEYLSIVMSMIFWLGVIFEIPLVMFLLAKLRLVSHRGFKKVRKYVPPSALILGSILAPGFDVVNALLVSIPIMVLYEVGLLLAWLAQPGKGKSVIHAIKAVVVGILRRVAVVLLLPFSLLLRLLYVAALSLVDVWDGNLSERVPSRGKARVDRVYKWWLRMAATVAHIEQNQDREWLECMKDTAPR